MREWLVASAVVEGPEGVLLVQNRRRDGSLDWSPPGGVIEVHEGESVIDGLTREVQEETGIRVTSWAGPLWELVATAEDMGWRMRVEVHLALTFEGELQPDDPDGIVVDARFVTIDDCEAHVGPNQIMILEPLSAWLAERWTESRAFQYRVDGAARAEMKVTRLG
ncbi:MAG: NUDIX hydrolase [Actinobacteria bacterium]|nr:NUDIX hydrolase [Actinomycetota bacterium]MBV8957816.1 NUDIX hydrolase [Actinomycetota bacterium]MBV9255799.1 NUDIX hydrolase [Actinomycetota bacterium]MBV9664917.1 NUDIX hydrolase [Actinomycetota bacterium]MBV9936253.1 NUDIX hydrolase [Actinomycetota bacterium]